MERVWVSRNTVIRVGLCLAFLAWFPGGMMYAGWAQKLLTPPRGQLVTTDMMAPNRAGVGLAAAVLSLLLGALIWGRFAPRGPYLQRVAVLLVPLLGGAAAAVLLVRWQMEGSGAAAARLGINPLIDVSALPILGVHLAGATVCLAAAGVLWLAGRTRSGLARRASGIS